MNPGDVVQMQVWGKFGARKNNSKQMADNLMVLLASAFGFNLPTLDAGLMANGFEHALAGQGLLADGTELPKAYLNYVFMDKHFQHHDAGFERLPAEALDNYKKLEKEVEIQKEGYIYIYPGMHRDRFLPTKLCTIRRYGSMNLR